MLLSTYTVALDKLELQLSYPEPLYTDTGIIDGFVGKSLNLATLDTLNALDSYTTGNTTLYRIEKPVGHYKLQYDVEINGTLFGFIRLLPTSVSTLFGGKPLVNLSINNKVLYSNKLNGLLDTLLESFQLIINNITRYDIALDSNTDTNDILLGHFHDTDLHFMCHNRSLAEILKVATLYRTGDENATFYVGKREAIQVVFYNKSAQTGKYTYQEHVKSFHHANGLDTDRDIYRIEVRVPRKALKRYTPMYQHHDTTREPITASQYNKMTVAEQLYYTKKSLTSFRPVTVAELVNPVKLLELFKLDFEALIDFRQKDKANKDRCTRIKIIDLKAVNNYILTQTITDSMNIDTNLQKKQIKNNLENYKYSKKVLYWEEAQTLADLYTLAGYFSQVQAKLRVKPPVPVEIPYDYGTRIRPSITSLFE